MRAAKSLRGDVRTGRTGPLSTMRPRSKTTTLSAIARASSRSWVTMTAVRRFWPRRDLAQQPPQRRGRGDVECRHRFVEQQHLRFGGQCPGDGDALGLSAGQLGGSSVGEVFGVDGVKPALCGGARVPDDSVPCTAGRRRRWRRRSCAGTAVPAGTASRHRGRAAGTKTPGAGVGDHRSAEFDPAVVGSQQPGDQLQQGGLPRAVGSENGEHLAVVEREVEFDVPFARGGPARARCS